MSPFPPRVAADHRCLSELTSRPRLEHEQELDELFARSDELLGNFDEKLLPESLSDSAKFSS